MSTLGPTGRESLTVLPQLLSAPRRSSSITWAEDVESVFWPWLVYISTVSITGSAFIFSSSSTQFHFYHQQHSDFIYSHFHQPIFIFPSSKHTSPSPPPAPLLFIIHQCHLSIITPTKTPSPAPTQDGHRFRPLQLCCHNLGPDHRSYRAILYSPSPRASSQWFNALSLLSRAWH
jgi:hypothetical protein